jgi:hypothetical protein
MRSRLPAASPYYGQLQSARGGGTGETTQQLVGATEIHLTRTVLHMASVSRFLLPARSVGDMGVIRGGLQPGRGIHPSEAPDGGPLHLPV